MLEIIVEISHTTLDYDLNDKKRIYASAGISEYWVVDLQNKELIVFREASDNDYKTKNTLSKGIIAPVTFPDLRINVSTFFPQN